MTVPASGGITGLQPGDGSNTLWQFDFSIVAADEIAVFFVTAAGGSSLVDSESYAVDFQPGSAGGTVTYPLDGLARVQEGEGVVLALAPDFDQPTDLKSQGPYSPEQVEDGLDHLARQIQALRTLNTQNVPTTPGIDASFGTPIEGAHLKWTGLPDGKWRLDSATESELGIPLGARVLYADDLGLKGDGTDETATINAKMLEYEGQNVVIFLRSKAGYWPVSSQIKVRSAIQLGFGSPLHLGVNGSVAMVGAYARQPTAAVVASAAAAGTTVLLCTPVAGALSATLAIGDQVDIGGHVYRVAGVNDSTSQLTIAAVESVGLQVAVAAGTGIRECISSYTTMSWGQQSTPIEITVANNSLFTAGDVVVIRDDELTVHLDGNQTQDINFELHVVVGLGVGSVILDSPCRHWCSTGFRARVMKLDPCRNASISGATAIFTAAPTSSRVDVFQGSLCYDCHFYDVRIPNIDNFGTRGQGVRWYQSLACSTRGFSQGPAKYFGAGEGYGVSYIQCTDCRDEGVVAYWPRHAVSFSGSTDCESFGPRARGWHSNFVDFHGLREIGCWAYDVDGKGQDANNPQFGITAGNSSWHGGSFDCGVQGGEISELMGATSGGINIVGPVDGFMVDGVTFRRCNYGISAENQQGSPDLTAGRVLITSVFDRCVVAAVINMAKYGGTTRPFDYLDLSGSRFYGCQYGLSINNVESLVANIFFDTTVHVAGQYLFYLVSVTGAYLTGTFAGCRGILRASGASYRLEGYTIWSPAGTAHITDESTVDPGNCRDAYGRYPVGYVPVRTAPTTSITVLSLAGMT
jgi:hypothetical protein